jgi:hypothetical protein
MMSTVLSLVDLASRDEQSFFNVAAMTVDSSASGDSNNCGSGDSRGC